MTGTPRRQLVLLGALVLALATLLVWRSGGDEAGPRQGAAAQRRAGGPAADAVPPVVDVRLERLEASRGADPAVQRNPFRFETRTLAPAPFQAGPRQPDPDVAPQPPQGPPPTPPIPLRFIGIFDAPTQAGRIAVLSDGRGNVFQGREGDIIEGRYRLLKIDTDSAELAYLDGRGRQMIRLSGQ